MKQAYKRAQHGVFVMAIVGAFLAGALLNPFTQADADTPAQGGAGNIVLEVSSIGTSSNPILVYESPDATSTVIVRLLWGDRVLWTGEETTDSNNNRWVKIYLPEGVAGWSPWNAFAQPSPFLNWVAVYTTPGMDIGKTIRITNDGNAANFRQNPGIQATRIRKLTAGETLTVIGGPYQTQYYIWWKLADSTGTEGWLVDVQNWFEVQP